MGNDLGSIIGSESDAQALRKVASDANDTRPIGELVEEFAELRDHLSVERKKFKDLEANLKSDMESLEVKILEKQRELGVRSISTDKFTAFQTSKVSVRMADWDSFSDWVLETGNIQCLEKRCAKLACLEIYEEKTAELREGMDPESDEYKNTRYNLGSIGLDKTEEIVVQVRKK